MVDTFSPAVYNIINNTTGATGFNWVFEGGVPSSSTLENPGNVSFSEPGEHIISLEVTNGRETFNLERIITVDPLLVADFNFEVDFNDDDFQTPVMVTIENNSISATSFQWRFTGATPATSSEENPTVVFSGLGVQSITLEATNGKETQEITKTITIVQNTNLRVVNEVILGINTAHNLGEIGAFYSLEERSVFTANELIEAEVLPNIDFVFFGLNSTFNRNRFVSPNNLSGTTFTELAAASNTLFINSQELCQCSSTITNEQFEAMSNDTLLNSLTIEETVGGSQDFDNSEVPRIVLFQTERGIKGAIRINEFVEDGDNSFINATLKFQKEAR